MKNRMSRCAALIGTVLSLSAFAQECQEISLYKDGSEIGKMEEKSRTFPEAPEWATNWGNLDGMIPPYIRLSGQKDKRSDWTGELSFEQMPVNVKGGSLKLKLRSTQKARVGIWLAGDFGKSQTHTLIVEAGKTRSIEVPVASLVGYGTTKVSRIGVGLMDVPAYQYTTLFVDDIALSCGVPAATDRDGLSAGSGTESDSYVYSDNETSSSARGGKFLESEVRETSAAYSDEKRKELSALTNLDFVVSLMEQNQILAHMGATSLTPKKSREGWFNNLYFIERNRLRDKVIANPKALFYEAEAFAASRENRETPLLLGNVDYGYESCVDTACSSTKILPSRLLTAGLPMAVVRGSKLLLHYDPYFVSSNRKNLPAVEIYTGGSWKKLNPKSSMEISFESAGLQKLQVRLTEGGLTVNQNLFVEVK